VTPDDAPIVAALRRGDRAGFDRAYERYHLRIHRFLLRLVRRVDIADDLVQDTWMALARSAGNLREDTDLAAWLFTVARNEARSHRRWSLLDMSRFVPLGDDPVASCAAGPELETEGNAAAVRLERALGAIGPDHREILLLVAIEGLSCEQVATVLDLAPAAVRKRLSRARQALADRLAALDRPAFALSRGAV
jgi:RNA polymerase sigma-70 factor (ECF subfamily)